RACLLWAWLIPPVLMFTLVHFGQWGYLLLILPPVTILGLLALERAEMLYGRMAAARLVALALVGALSFLLMPSVRMPGHEMQPVRGCLVGVIEASREVPRFSSELPPDRTVALTRSDILQSFRIAGFLVPVCSVVGVGRDLHGNWGSLYDAIDGQS